MGSEDGEMVKAALEEEEMFVGGSPEEQRLMMEWRGNCWKMLDANIRGMDARMDRPTAMNSMSRGNGRVCAMTHSEPGKPSSSDSWSAKRGHIHRLCPCIV